jgi:hypothetical protein
MVLITNNEPPEVLKPCKGTFDLPASSIAAQSPCRVAFNPIGTMPGQRATRRWECVVMFMRRLSFSIENICRVPKKPGVYIIYDRGSRQPVYVGRSRVDIRQRLLRHVQCRGSRKIAQALLAGAQFTFEYEPMLSVEQAEATLIHEFGDRNELFNLRRETDPADW